MKRSRITPKSRSPSPPWQAEFGITVGEVCGEMGVSDNAFYRWKRQYVDIGVAEFRHLKLLEEGNRSSLFVVLLVLGLVSLSPFAIGV